MNGNPNRWKLSYYSLQKNRYHRISSNGHRFESTGFRYRRFHMLFYNIPRWLPNGQDRLLFMVNMTGSTGTKKFLSRGTYRDKLVRSKKRWNNISYRLLVWSAVTLVYLNSHSFCKGNARFVHFMGGMRSRTLKSSVFPW